MFRDKQGMTLIEVMIALLVLSISITPLLSSFLVSAKQLASSERKAAALYKAQGILEDVVQQNYDNINDLLKIDGELSRVAADYGYTEALNVIAQDNRDNNVLLASAATGYSYTVEVTEQNAVKKIIVTVYYMEPSVGRETSIKLAGARAKR
ncbi:prepilin-type N-terminal cleavage/methylation domain-containing protein [Desulfotomaculum arcticum]|uniref:Prepilin-type N-terminal cleavage/methylation domain-containing protein n=1 Tax=Desulfotruncus arcticus DSM 17038 TaxID=1121424 RepID=A0A1I2MNU3_9FIRM|nr:type II secretion system protein [Desulfotruncus arcticus]SFF92590.1 prepilin-type N-terminal cleavage/methylation domain-containing protein [Desulfotomaculum arcticum] [Desulfotruncus arcticus DSM 17038]